MLVLTRKLMEKLYIGKDVCVTVVRLEGGQVRLGIEAPRDISVVRAELVDDRAAHAPKETVEYPKIALPPAHNPAPLRIRPASVRGTDSRRREPSR